MKLLLLLLILFSINCNAKIVVTSLEGNSYIFNNDKRPKRIGIKTNVYENSIIATSSKGLAIIDFRDEVVGTVILSPNTKVILRTTNTVGVRLLSVIEGNVRFFKTKELKKKRSGVLINIRDNTNAYHGNHFEVHYTNELKRVTSFDGDFRKLSLLKSQKRKEKKIKIRRGNTELTDQELEEDLKFLLDN
jgi:hypothetical protein